MSSKYLCSSEDDFFRALDESLTMEYSTQKMSHFLSDLLVAINNLEDDPQNAFVFYDHEEDSNVCKFFSCQPPESNTLDEPRYLRRNRSRNKLTSKRKAHETSVDIFENVQPKKLLRKNEISVQRQSLDVSVDMFDEEEDEESVDLFDDELPQAPEFKVPSRPKLTDISVDMFAEFQDGPEMVDADSNYSDNISVHRVNDFQKQETVDSVDINKQQAPDVTILSTTEVVGQVVSETPQDIDTSADTNDNRIADVYTEQQLHLQNVDPIPTAEKIENEDLGQSFDILLCVPSNISYCEPNENERNLSVALDTKQISGQHVKETGSPYPIQTAANVSIQSIQSSNQSSAFRGFSSVGSVRNTYVKPTTASSGSDKASTICEEYLMSYKFIPTMRRPSSECSDLYGFPSIDDDDNAIASIGHSAVQYNSTSRSECEFNSTFCEEFETVRSMALEMNASQINFNFEIAYSQCFLEGENQASSNADRKQLFIEEIEKLILKIQNDLVCGRTLSIEIPYTVCWNHCAVDNERIFLEPLSNGRKRVVNEKPRIAMIVYLLSFIYKLLINNETCTKREIYYSDPEFTQSQLLVDKAVMDICFILNARPWELGIFSSSKGLIAGPIKITLQDDTILDVGSNDEGILLPHQTINIKKVETNAKFVLLVEKHTIYEKLLMKDVLNRLGPCILVTGKGYPDINTRAILRKIWDDCKCPIYALCDADPYGIEIMLSYRHGTKNSSFFNGDLAIPSIRWIGVYPSEVKKFNLLSLPLGHRDVIRLNSLVKRQYLSTAIYEELLVLQKTLQKSEVESLMACDGIVDWIDSYLLHKIQSGALI